jgi:integrase
VELHAALGLALMFSESNSERARLAFSRGLKVAEEREGLANQLRMLSRLHIFHHRTEDFRTAHAFALQGERVAGAIADPMAVAAAHELLGLSYLYVEDLVAARTHLEAALVHVPLSPCISTFHFGFDYRNRAGIILARALWLLGYSDQAAVIARRTAEEAWALDHSLTLCIAHIYAVSVCLWIGDWISAGEFMDKLVAHARRRSIVPYEAAARLRNWLHCDQAWRCRRWYPTVCLNARLKWPAERRQALANCGRLRSPDRVNRHTSFAVRPDAKSALAREPTPFQSPIRRHMLLASVTEPRSMAMDQVNAPPTPKRVPWNKGKLTGAKPPLRPKHVWSIRTKLQIEGRARDLAMFNLAIDSKLRGCDVVALRVEDVAPGGYTADRATVRQKKARRPVRFELGEQTRQAVDDYLKATGKRPGEFLFTGYRGPDRNMTTRQYARLVSEWIGSVGLDPRLFGTHSLRRTKATLIYRRTGNLRAVQLLLGHTKIESTVRYLGIEVDDALAIAEQVDV